MHIQKITKSTKIVRFFVTENSTEIGRASLVLVWNDLHKEPYGLLEDVFVDPPHRGQGIGQQLVEAVIGEAKARGCYKLIGMSRNERDPVHAWYQSLGFIEYGKEFRMDFL